MNLHDTIIKITGFHLSKENALKFADEQFGLLAAYLRKHPYRQPTKYDAVIKETSMLEIDETALIHGVILELEDKHLFHNKTDAVYSGSIFKEIISHYEKGEIQFPLKTLRQLKELEQLFGDYTYFRVNNVVKTLILEKK